MSVFNADSIVPENPLETLVGEGKKYATVDELARAKFHADAAIAQRESENAELRAELSTRLAVEEALKKLNQTPVAPIAPLEGNQPPKPTAVTQEDLAKLVRDELELNNQQTQVQRNVEEVVNKLVGLFGSEEKANQVIKQKAAELGLPLDFLQGVAQKSPKAFFATVGINSEVKAPSGPTHGDVNLQAFNVNNSQVKPNTYAWYEQLRKTDPKVYFSPKVQNQMHSDALKFGGDFFNKT